MNILKNIFSNESIKKLAFGSLRKHAEDNGIKAIVLISDSEKEGGDLPGFDIHFFKEKIQVFDEETVGISKEQFDHYNNLIELENTYRAFIIENAETNGNNTAERESADIADRDICQGRPQ